MHWIIDITNPRWITNCAITDVFLYDNLPCHNTKRVKSLNLRIEKSDAKAACLPYLPTIPTPISATWIMPTSLPPSPMPKTNFPVWFFTPVVMIAFWVGDTLQQITAGAYVAAV
jgi:hypothetical protein